MGGGGGGGLSRDFDSNPGISDNLSRDWTSLGWQVCFCHQLLLHIDKDIMDALTISNTRNENFTKS